MVGHTLKIRAVDTVKEKDLYEKKCISNEVLA